MTQRTSIPLSSPSSTSTVLVRHHSTEFISPRLDNKVKIHRNIVNLIIAHNYQKVGKGNETEQVSQPVDIWKKVNEKLQADITFDGLCVNVLTNNVFVNDSLNIPTDMRTNTSTLKFKCVPKHPQTLASQKCKFDGTTFEKCICELASKFPHLTKIEISAPNGGVTLVYSVLNQL